MLLRPRQEEFVEACVAALEEHGNTLGVAPTGAGKTVMLSGVIGRLIDKGLPSGLILQHRDELVGQNRRTFHALNGNNIRTGQIDKDRKDWGRPFSFAMVQTLSRNLDRMPKYDIIVTDEAHHSAAESYRKIYKRARELNDNVLMLGVTATPNRGDKKPLKGIFNNVADQITIGELIASGNLVRPRTFVIDLGVQEELREVRRSASDFDMSEVSRIMNKQILNEKIVEQWKEKAGDRQTVVFCSTIDHAEGVTATFVAAGVSARMLHGNMSNGERERFVKEFDQGQFQVAINVAVLTEGWDCQPVSCVVLLRPSSYASTMVQMIGRGLRKMDPERYPGRPPKTDCIVLDFGTSVLTHGSLEQDINLEGREREPGEALKKECPECLSKVPINSRECAICGHVFVEDLDLGGGGGGSPTDTLEDFVLTEIDIFKTSPFKWEELWDGLVMVATAFHSWAVVVNYQGQWWAVGGGKAYGIKLLEVGEKMLCLSSADDFMREHGDRDAARKSKTWLHMPATPQQLKAIGLPQSAAGSMGRYEASCHLTWKFNERGIRMKIEGASLGRAA